MGEDFLPKELEKNTSYSFHFWLCFNLQRMKCPQMSLQEVLCSYTRSDQITRLELLIKLPVCNSGISLGNRSMQIVCPLIEYLSMNEIV